MRCIRLAKAAYWFRQAEQAASWILLGAVATLASYFYTLDLFTDALRVFFFLFWIVQAFTKFTYYAYDRVATHWERG